MKTTKKMYAIILLALLTISTLSVFTEFAQATVGLSCTATLIADNSGAGKDATYTFTITNTGAAKLGSANITIPTGYSNVVPLQITGPTSQIWSIQKTGNYLLIKGSAEGLTTGAKVTFTFSATNPVTPQ